MNFQKKTLKINGDTYHIQELSARQRKEALKLYKDEMDPIDLQANYIQMGVSELKDKTLDDILDLPGSVFSQFVDEVMTVSGLTDKDEAKNS